MDLTFPRLGSFFLVAILAAGCSAWLHPGRYERKIERHHTTDGEREAIAAAEHLDYDRYLPPGANIIDSGVLDRFDSEFRSVKAESGSVESLILRYTASATWFPAMELEVASDGVMITFEINGERVLSEMELLGMYTFMGHDVEGQWRLLIPHEYWFDWAPEDRVEWALERGHHVVDSPFLDKGPILEKTTKGAYLVSMDLVYDEFHGPLAAYSYKRQQILVLDEDFEVLAMIVHAISAVS